jgi:hypothetical protein
LGQSGPCLHYLYLALKSQQLWPLCLQERVKEKFGFLWSLEVRSTCELWFKFQESSSQVQLQNKFGRDPGLTFFWIPFWQTGVN